MDPKELLLRHFEKVVIGAFGLWFAYVAYTAVLSSPADMKDNDKLRATIEKIETHMKTYTVELPKLEDPTAELQAQVDPSRVPPVEGFPSWLAHKRPNLAYAVASGPAKVYPKHFPPNEFHVTDKGRGRVKLAWKQSSENEYVNVTGYEIQRKDNSPDAEWKPVGTNLDANKLEWEDTTVGPRSKYWYRLKESAAAQLDNPVIVRDKTDLPPEQRDLFADEIKEAVETPQDVYITVDGGEATDETTDKKGSVQCKVWRWSQTAGKFLYKAYLNVPAGAKIGQKEKIREGNKTVDFDFSTDAVLVRVSVEKRKQKSTGVERDTIIAQVKWPWMGPKDKPDEIVEKEDPPEIAAQKKSGKP